MQQPITFTPSDVWTLLLALAAAITAFSAAGAAIGKWIAAARKPNADQNKRIDALEKWKTEADSYFKRDKMRIDKIEEGSRVTQQALLALLDHSLDGNNEKQMQDAKEALQKHLVYR